MSAERGVSASNEFMYSMALTAFGIIVVPQLPTWLRVTSSDIELRPVHKENSQVRWCPLQLQHCDVVG